MSLTRYESKGPLQLMSRLVFYCNFTSRANAAVFRSFPQDPIVQLPRTSRAAHCAARTGGTMRTRMFSSNLLEILSNLCGGPTPGVRSAENTAAFRRATQLPSHRSTNGRTDPGSAASRPQGPRKLSARRVADQWRVLMTWQLVDEFCCLSTT